MFPAQTRDADSGALRPQLLRPSRLALPDRPTRPESATIGDPADPSRSLHLVETIMCGDAVIRGFAPRGIVPPFRILQAYLCGRRLPEDPGPGRSP